MMRMPAQLASACDVSSLFDVAVVRAILERGVLAAGPLKGRLRDVRVERYWPVRRGGISLEWSFHVGDGLRHSVFARPMPTAPCYDDRPAISTEVGLANIRVSLPERKLLVHSPDRDPELPHLAECLDGHRVAKHLESAIRHRTTAARDGGAPCPIPLDRRICCRPVGYRAGRRAAIAYSPYGNGDVSAWMLGKTYRNDRGRRVLDVRSRLNEQLPEMTGGRVRVPAPLGYVPELQMALFSWSRGAKPGSSPNELGDETGTTVDVLAALHRTWLPELPEFTVDDERAVVQRWYHLLRSVSEADVSQAAPLFDALLQAGESVDSFQRRTIHRDFYDSQLLCTRRTVTVLDLDTLAVGDPCVDLGNWIAHAWLALLCAGNGGGGLAALPDDVADRYEARLGPVDRRTLAFYCASAAFRLGAVHAFRTSTGRHAPRLWALARAALRGGPRRTCS